MKFRQSRVLCCIFYSLDDIHLFIDKLKLDNGRYAYIYHDKDIKTDGTPKEPHYHFYARRQSPFTPQTVARLIAKCSQNVLVENLKSTDNAFLGYFTHDEVADKAKYDPADIVANFDVSRVFNSPAGKSQYIDPAEIIAMFDDGYTTIDVIRRYPKLLYSVSNLTKTEMLIREQKKRLELSAKVKNKYADKPCSVVQMHVLPNDDELPF